ncbi:hypothetical protein [Stygiolobus caldivivus]|uniref:Uncharacterized protein n=1 Tax=Stygiolobus caldivivus TaxID=2824673 RepID=A0A8D5U550_9CREN|nr:hypothetical protein [Stygiolobus caldivivus]BCU69685.1 hypothetical protein KN1_09820 [Stygiolobus caldivivus]
MVSKDEVKNAILKITEGRGDIEFTRNGLYQHTGKSKKVDDILEELIKEGFIKVSRTAGRAKYYVLNIEGAKPVGEEKGVKGGDKGDMEGVKRALREVLEEYFGKPKDFKDLDRVYEEMKDDLGYVQIKDLREQLGLTLEQFMAKFRDYVVKNYELIPGGKEGIINSGAVYGIIRKKKV